MGALYSLDVLVHRAIVAVGWIWGVTYFYTTFFYLVYFETKASAVKMVGDCDIMLVVNDEEMSECERSMKDLGIKDGDRLSVKVIAKEVPKATWTEKDQNALEMLEKLNEGVIKVNYHELLNLGEKKAKFQRENESDEGSSDDAEQSDHYYNEFVKFLHSRYAKGPSDFNDYAVKVLLFQPKGDFILSAPLENPRIEVGQFKELVLEKVYFDYMLLHFV